MSLIGELKRRNVIRVATAYVAVSWLVVQVLDVLFPMFGLSDGAARIVVIVLAIGFIPALIGAWVFEWTPEGLKRDDAVDHDAPARVDAGRRMDRAIIAILAVAVVFFAFDKFVLDPERDAQLAEQVAEQTRDEALIDSYGEHSIAVVPFIDLSPANDQEYFSDGIAEEIINLLSRIRDLRVIARSSAFAFKGQGLAASVIAERLNVRYVMEGSVRRAGDRLRITTTVIDASTNTQVWSENFDRDFGDVFAIQDEIAGEVVDRLEMQISGKLPAAERADPEAFALYLQAKHLRLQTNAESTEEARLLLEQALEIDPDYIPALLFQINVNASRFYWGNLTREEQITQGREIIETVLRLDPANPDGLALRRLFSQPALESREAQLDGATYALQLSPTNLDGNKFVAHLLANYGQFERALDYSEYVLGKDPLCIGCLRNMMLTLMALGDYDRATEVCNRYRLITGGSGTYNLGLIQLLQGDPESALATMESFETFPFVHMQGRAITNWEMGRLSEYEFALADLEAAIDDAAFAKTPVRPEDFLAGTYAWVGRIDDAFEILDRRIGHPGQFEPSRWNTDPIFRNLHDDPRWLDLLEKAELAPRHIESYRLDERFPGPGIKPDFEVPDV